MWYRLDAENAPVACTYEEYNAWRKTLDCRVFRVAHCGASGSELFVSTVFLGMEHGFRDGRPLLFETMVFGGEGELERYTSYEDAVAGHAKFVEKYADNPSAEVKS